MPIKPKNTNPSAMIMCDIPDVLTSGVVAGIVPGVRHKVSICHLILLLVLHHVFCHCIMATESRREKVDCNTFMFEKMLPEIKPFQKRHQ